MRAVMRRVAAVIRVCVFATILALALPSGIRADSHKTCALEGENFMAFGNYDTMTNSPLDLQGRVSYSCSNHATGASDSSSVKSNGGNNGNGNNGNGNGPLTVRISLSAGDAGGYNRYMSGPNDQLHYNLYIDAQRHAVWGDGTGGTSVYTEQAQPNGHVVAVPVYGRVFAAQDVQAGNYMDHLIVTLDF